MEKNRIRSLDSLRGIACLIVLAAHIISTNPNFGIYASGCGKIGVWCFMVLSGFLTFLPYASGKKNNTENLYIARYYKKKFLKLYPAYIVILVFALLLGFFTDSRSILTHLICAEGVGHFWYMPVIVKFYILVPFLVILLERVKNRIFVIVLFISAAAFGIIFPFSRYIENSINLYWYIPVFFTGCLSAFFYVKIQDVASNTLNNILKIASIISAICIVLLTPKVRELIWAISPSGWLQNKYIPFAILWAIIILEILNNQKIGEFLSECKPLRFMGKISFEVYLIHYLVLWKTVQYTNNTLRVALIVSVISILLSAILHYVISKCQINLCVLKKK